MDANDSQAMSNLQRFLLLYETTVRDNNSINMDVEGVLKDISENILDPQSKSEELNQLYQKGKNLNRAMVNETTARIKKLKDDKIYQLIIDIERTHHQLNKDYETEIKKGVQTGVYKILNR